eukprot:CAMPEP_0177491012 /NCGR_PEP_ID=MMETSP0369-20130122/31585_1 /TAXON_ID=447022 ORGANISM="Scrippsiella hangoei-like, Strain SHHI-4" /NCGR_SAMPLE_ID=MMETSP0369 /ASSEMBLY_ACC=CAM_ASM_000364 /LENGTH=46 /DNA_ID= /DNA_START= /DNA_END= /DNA_ORIENTATION=
MKDKAMAFLLAHMPLAKVMHKPDASRRCLRGCDIVRRGGARASTLP